MIENWIDLAVMTNDLKDRTRDQELVRLKDQASRLIATTIQSRSQIALARISQKPERSS